jgi:hypothetical protein
MSKKRAGKSKRRREQQRTAAAGKSPRLVLVSNAAVEAHETADDSIEEAPATARSGSARNSPSGIQATSEAAPSESEPAKAEPAKAEPAKAEPAKAEPAKAEPVEVVGEKSDAKPEGPAAKGGDLEEEERFFREGRIQTPHAFVLHDDLLDPEPPKPSPKMTPAARARRAQFSKYVKGAMVAGVAILALAGIRVAVGHADRGPNAAAYLAAHVQEPVAQAQTEPFAPPAQTVATTGANTPAAEKAPPSEPIPAAEKPVEPAKTEPAANPEPEKVAAAEKPAPAEPAKPELAKAEPASEPKTEPKAEAAPAPAAATGKAALQEKQDAQRLLERGKAAAAIEAGERSVAIDPTDGEAWLILGAAYQEKGNLKDARRAFTSCTKEGKRGPISECKAMLR